MILYDIIEYDNKLIFFDQTENITDLQKIKITALPIDAEQIKTTFKVRATDTMSGLSSIYDQEIILTIFKKVYDDNSIFGYNGNNEGLTGSSSYFSFYGIISSEGNITYQIDDISCPYISFDKYHNILEDEQIKINFLIVNEEETCSFNVYAYNDLIGKRQFCETIYVTIKLKNNSPNDFVINPRIHNNAIEGQYYYGSTLITGINSPTTWIITNGEGSIDGINYSSSGIVNNNQVINVRAQADYSGEKVLKLTVFDKSADMTIVTKEIRVPNILNLYPSYHDNCIENREYISYGFVQGINTISSWKIINGEGSVDGGLTYSNDGEIGNNQTILVKGKANKYGTNVVSLLIDGFKKVDMMINTVLDKIPDCISINPPIHVNCQEDMYYYGTALITGINTEVTWSVEHGEGSTNDSDYRTTGKINNGETIKLRAKIKDNQQWTFVKLNINGISGVMVLDKFVKNEIRDDCDCFIIDPPIHENAIVGEEYSGTTTITGLTTEVPFVVKNGAVSINNGPFVTAGVVKNNDELLIKTIAINELRSTILTIGNKSAAMTIIPTSGFNQIPDCFSIIPPVYNEVEIGKEYYGTARITGINKKTVWVVSNAVASSDGGKTFSQTGLVEDRQTIIIKAIGSSKSKLVEMTIGNRYATMILNPYEEDKEINVNVDVINNVTQDVDSDCTGGQCGGSSPTPTPTPTPTPSTTNPSPTPSPTVTPTVTPTPTPTPNCSQIGLKPYAKGGTNPLPDFSVNFRDRTEYDFKLDGAYAAKDIKNTSWVVIQTHDCAGRAMNPEIPNYNFDIMNETKTSATVDIGTWLNTTGTGIGCGSGSDLRKYKVQAKVEFNNGSTCDINSNSYR